MISFQTSEYEDFDKWRPYASQWRHFQLIGSSTVAQQLVQANNIETVKAYVFCIFITTIYGPKYFDIKSQAMNSFANKTLW